MVSSLSSAVNLKSGEMGRRGEVEADIADSSDAHFIVPVEKREQPELKDVGVMFAMKEHCVVTTLH